MRSQVFITPKPMFFPLHTPRETPIMHDQRGRKPMLQGRGVHRALPSSASQILLTNHSDSWGKAQEGRADPADSGWLTGWLAAPYSIGVELLNTSMALFSPHSCPQV